MEDKIIDTSSRAFDELVEDLGLNSFSEKEKERLLLKTTEMVLKRIFVDAMEKIGKDGRIEYEQLAEKKPTPDEIKSFFSEKISDFDGLVEKTIETLREEMASEQN